MTNKNWCEDYHQLYFKTDAKKGLSLGLNYTEEETEHNTRFYYKIKQTKKVIAPVKE